MSYDLTQQVLTDGFAAADTFLLTPNLVEPLTGIQKTTVGGTNDVTSLEHTGDFDPSYGYGLVDANAAVAWGIGEYFGFVDAPELGGNNWANDMINAPDVWQQDYTGQGVVVAVIDTGVDYTHADLDDNIWVNANEVANDGVDNDGNGYIDDVLGWNFVEDNNNPMDTDESGHGTHVAGTIAAENNDFGVTGVAYNANIMSLRVLGDEGGTNADIAEAIYYAVDNGAQVINLSLGGPTIAPEIEAALAYAASNNVLTVSASGNESSPVPGYPAAYATEYGLAVGAVDSNGNVADFSNGAGTDSDMQFVVAPGVEIYSTLPGNTYGALDGTSMASPHVAGVAALMLSANPDLTAEEIQTIITQTAVS